MSVEQSLIRAIDRRAGKISNIEFSEKIQRPWDNLRPKLNEFSGVYPREEIKKDSEEITKLESKFDIKGQKALTGEIAIMEAIYEDQWLTPDVEVMPTSKYDDIKNGIDFVLRFDTDEDKKAYLGVDVTTSREFMIINNKRSRILQNLNRGDNGKLKYFVDEAEEIKGALDLPMVAIIINPDDVMKLQSALLDLKNKKVAPQEKKILEKIRKDFEQEVRLQVAESMEYIRESLKAAKRSTKPGIKNPRIERLENILTSYRNIAEQIKERTN